MLSALWDAKTARVLFTLMMFLLVLAFLHGARETLTLFLFAILFAYFIEPIVALLQRLLHGRIKGIVATYLLLGGLGTGLGFALGPMIASEVKDLVASLPKLADRVASGQFVYSIIKNQGWTQQRAMQIQQVFMDHRAEIFAYIGGLAEQMRAPLTHIWWIVLIPILSVFFLKDAGAIARGLVLLGGDNRKRLVFQRVVNDVNVMLGSYIRAQLILASLTGVVLTVGLALTHVPFAFVLGPVAGIFEFIPVVGPAVASVAIFGLALLAGYPHLLWIFLFLGTWRTIQDYVNAPRIMGSSLEISPLAEIFGVLAGGEIGGVIGALVSVPVMAILRILWRRLRAEEEAGELAA